jgi:hypothetical protein
MKNRPLVDRLGTFFDTPVEEITLVSDDELESRIVGLSEVADRLHAELVHSIAEFDHRNLALRTKRLTTKAWLRSRCRWTARTATRFVHQARSLRRMPATLRLARSGQIPPDSLQVLTSAERRIEERYISHEGILADAASYLTVPELRQAVDHFEQSVARDVVVATAHERQRSAYLHMSHTLEGMWRLDGWLDPERGAIVSEALNAHIHPTLLDASDGRTMSQRRAEAVTDICRFTLDHDADLRTAGGERPHISVTVDYEMLTEREGPLPSMSDTPVDPEMILKMACDSGIVRIITDGDSMPLDVGRRTRTIPPAIRRAVEHRDGHCTWAGCERPASWCDAHHIEHWADGGPTCVDNLTLLCRYHHTRTHQLSSHPPRGSPSG